MACSRRIILQSVSVRGKAGMQQVMSHAHHSRYSSVNGMLSLRMAISRALSTSLQASCQRASCLPWYRGLRSSITRRCLHAPRCNQASKKVGKQIGKQGEGKQASLEQPRPYLRSTWSKNGWMTSKGISPMLRTWEAYLRALCQCC